MAVQADAFDDEAARQLAESAARMLGIAIAPEWMPAVVRNLRANSAAAELLLDHALDDEAESAMVFRP
ncbi:MAG: DUF4089 domain-containing protein [Pseudomonadota bacterium]|jgi:hypothetical protein